MRALIRPPSCLARQRCGLALSLAVLLVVAGCASVGTDGGGGSHGTSGVITWEVSDIGRILSADNQRIRWSYVITIRNTGDRAIQLDRVERAISSTRQDVTGGTPTSRPYRQRIEAQSTVRYAANEEWGWRPNSGTVGFGGVTTVGTITSYRRFFGSYEGGAAIEVEARVRLDPSVGVLATPPTRPDTLPPPRQLGSSDLGTMVGLWRGSYRVDQTRLDIPIEADIQPDGTVRIAENLPVTNRFSRTVQVKDGGLEYSGNRERGTLTLHEGAGKRMLVGRVSPPDGGAYAVYLEAQAPVPAAMGPPAASVPTLASTSTSTTSTPMPSASIDLTGSYRGTLTGLRGDRSYFDRVTVAVVQNGREFSGTWTTPTASGTLSGTLIDGTNFTLRLHQATPCVVDFEGVGTTDDSRSRLAASYRGGSCQGGDVAASIVVTRGTQ
jgi:hypothetical protein